MVHPKKHSSKHSKMNGPTLSFKRNDVFDLRLSTHKKHFDIERRKENKRKAVTKRVETWQTIGYRNTFQFRRRMKTQKEKMKENPFT
jgi:hypothetical protein